MQQDKKIEYPDTPVWKPLQTAVGSRCREFMWMGKTGKVFLYKHLWTRRYLNLDLDGNAYRFTGEGYETLSLEDAIKYAFN